VNMARGTGAGAPAFGFNAWNGILDRRFHNSRADLGIDGAGSAFVIDVSDVGHASAGGKSVERQAAIAARVAPRQ
jgi:hypothetical protein